MSISKLCRICFNEQKQLISMHNLYFDGTPAINFIKEVLHIQIQGGTVGIVMCDSCNNALNSFYSFYKMVREVQDKYNTLMNPKHRLSSPMILTVYPMEEQITEAEYTQDDQNKQVREVSLHIKESCKENIDTEDVLKVESDILSKTESMPCSPVEVNQNDIEETLKILNEMPSDDLNENISNNIEESIIPTVEESPDAESNTVTKALVTKKKHMILWEELKMKQCKATEVMFSKYKLEEMCKSNEWLLSEEQRDEMLSLYSHMVCIKCDNSTFPSYTELVQHSLREHDALPLLMCCCTETTDRTALEKHILYKHILKRKYVPRQQPNVNCPVCNKVVKKGALRNHVAIHVPDDKQEFQCDYCQKGFPIKFKLTQHIMMKHLGLTSNCKDCGKTFPSPVHLQLHQRNVHNPSKEIFLCPDCGKEYITRQWYNNHMDKHKGVPMDRVKCNICGIVLNAKYVTSHMRKVHNREKLKQCPHCPYKGLNLTGHIKRVHEKIRPFNCSACSMSFHTALALKDHIASRHTGIPGYACEFCSKTFMSSGNCHSHRKRMHSTQLAEKKMKKANEINTDDIPMADTFKKKKVKKILGAEEN